MPQTSDHSQALFRRACAVLPGGTSRLTTYFPPHPLYAASGTGCWIRDVDGVERLDCHNNYTTLIHGHAHPKVAEAVRRQLERGWVFGMATEAEVQLAELVVDRVPSIERVRFTNSGTEAVMMAIKAARAYTGRPKIARCEGAYHGSYDFAEVSTNPTPETWGSPDPHPVPRSRGTPASVLGDVVVIPFNDAAAARRLLDAHAADLACIVLDPLPNRAGLVPATSEFLAAVHAVAERHGILLVLDEVISFRLGYRGAQGAFGLTPDLTALGKIIGGGFAIGAVGGRADVMAVFDPSRGPPPLPHAGTFSANPVAMEAGRAALELLTPAALQELNALGERARQTLHDALAAAGARAQVTGMGSLFRVHFTDREISDYRSAFPSETERALLSAFHRALLECGIFLAENGLGALSTVMTDREIALLGEAVEQAARRALRGLGGQQATDGPGNHPTITQKTPSR